MWEGFNTGDRGSAHRFHLPDPVTFKKSLRLEIEHKGYQKFPDGRATAASNATIYFPVSPSGIRPNRTSPGRRYPLAMIASRSTKKLLLKGHEAVASAKHSNHPLEVQGLGGVTDGKQLWPADRRSGWVEVSFRPTKISRSALHGKSRTHGITVSIG